MFEFASRGIEGFPQRIVAQVTGCRSGASDWVADGARFSGKYEFVGQPKRPLMVKKSQRRTSTKVGSNPCSSGPLWKSLLEAWFALAFFAITFGVFGWMFFNYTIEFASLGELQITDYLQQICR